MPTPSRSLLYRAAAAAADRLERFARVPSPAAASASMPFTGAPQPPGNAPPPDYLADQPPPPPVPLRMIPGYHDHTYRAPGQPIGVGGFNVARMRSSIEIHDTGASFLETSLLASAVTRYAPVHAALAQCIAPVMDLPRYIRGGTDGIAKEVADEVEAQLCPRGGALSSVYFPTSLWGALAIEVSFMNFAVLQHVDGDPDPDTGVRPRYSRRWPVWATICDMYRRTYRANTTEGPVDILNDGKFTLIADEELPHLNSPIRALGAPVMSGVLTDQSNDAYVNKYGDPKPIGEMPPNVGVETPEGKLFLRSMNDFRNPGGIILLPNGAKVSFAQLEARTSSVFTDNDEKAWRYIAAVMLGSDGTMSKGTGGVYPSPMFADVKRSINGRRLVMIVRGINDGHINPFVVFNYLASMQAARADGTWVTPILDVPLPDPEADARFEAEYKRMKNLADQIILERSAGAPPDQPRVKAMAIKLGADPITLTDNKSKPDIFAWEVDAKIFAPDEVRENKGRDPLPNGAGSVKKLAEERAEGRDQIGKEPAQPAAPKEESPA